MEKEFREIAGVLREAKRRNLIKDYALTGALALSALTKPRATSDIDFIIAMEEEKIPFFLDWLKYVKSYNLAKHHAGRRKDRIKNLIEVPLGNTWADFIVAAHDIEKDALTTGITVSAFKNVRLKVVRPEYLFVLKLLAGSDQDLLDCAQLWHGMKDKRRARKLAMESFAEGKLKKVESLARRIQRG